MTKQPPNPLNPDDLAELIAGNAKAAAPADAVVPHVSEGDLLLDESGMARLSSFERRRLREEAKSLEHLLTHEPKKPFCLD